MFPWAEWFPDAPAWIPWAALFMNGALFLLFLACLVANPLEAWRLRHEAKTSTQVNDLRRFQKIQPDLLNAPTKKGVTAELARIKS